MEPTILPAVRADGRGPGDLRPIEILPGFVETAHGSALITMGRTRVICTASVDEGVPPWRRGQGLGWVTAEYGMLPGSTGDRKQRESPRAGSRAHPGDSAAHRPLVARRADLRGSASARSWVDCDVLQADGGTRCAAISGGYVALHQALAGWSSEGAARAPAAGHVRR